MLIDKIKIIGALFGMAVVGYGFIFAVLGVAA